MTIGRLRSPVAASSEWRAAFQPAVEAQLLHLIRSACIDLQSDTTRRAYWQEGDYTFCLYLHLESMCRAKGLPFVPRTEGPVMTEQEFRNGASAKTSSRIDLVIWYHNRRPEIHFAIEAKVVTQHTIGSRRPTQSIRRYVLQGVRKFVDGHYAPDHPVAAMVAYVISGELLWLVDRINTMMRDEGIPCDEFLSEHPGFRAPPEHYVSRHPRTGQCKIQLHHVFVFV